MAPVIEPAVRGFPPVPEVAWSDDAYVAPPTFVDGEPAAHQPIVLPEVAHMVVVAETGLALTEEPSQAASAPSGAAPAPAVTAILPATGAHGGGTAVVITGTHFEDALAVKFGTLRATFVQDSPTQITATAPAAVAGVVDVKVTTPVAVSATVAADRFTYT